jgi:cytochrome P450
VFENPDVFDPDRFLRKRPTRDEYSPFGLDRHACIGEGLARAMGEMFARELTRYAWEVTTDGPAQMSSWRHWEPSSRFRVRLALRAPASVSP